MRNIKDLRLFTLHTSKDNPEFRAAILARNPFEAASMAGGQFIEWDGYPLGSSTDPKKLGIHGVVRFGIELFREADETDNALGAFGTCLTNGVIALRGTGKAVDLVIREHHVSIPSYVK